MLRIIISSLLIIITQTNLSWAERSFNNSNKKQETSTPLVEEVEQYKPFNFGYSSSATPFTLGEDIGFGLQYTHSLMRKYQPWGTTISNDVVRLGEKALKFETRRGFCGYNPNGWSDCKNGRNRHEFSSRFFNQKHFPLNQTFWHALSLYVPDEPKFEIPVETGLFQFHGKPNLAFKFHFSDTRGFYLTNYVDMWGGKTFINPEDFVDRWHDIVIEIRHSKNADGYMNIWINGKLEHKFSGITTRRKGRPYLKFGIYNTAKPVGNPKYDNGALFNDIWVYFDEIRFAKTCSGLKLADLGYDCANLLEQ